ncbi:MAG TPA: 50S ribosomal protein L25/general stress protein Ctc [Thermodesulfobacteriota bacterium]|nr:50S ribosomal protein L25/general stress protein Ctc [Thermodesulfobacteriota bacterium]
MEKPVLNAEVRDKTGKEMAKKLRVKGLMPAIFYGPNSETIALTLDPKELSKTLQTEAGENVLIDLNIRKGEESLKKVVMLKELQVQPLQRRALHADFFEVSMDVMVTVEIPVHLLGKSEGVKVGGILEQVQRTIQIECLPGDIPRSIDVDVSALKIGDSIHVSDLKLEKFKILSDLNFTIATVVPPVAEAKPAEEAAAEEAPEAEAEAKEAKEEEK